MVRRWPGSRIATSRGVVGFTAISNVLAAIEPVMLSVPTTAAARAGVPSGCRSDAITYRL